MQGGYCRMQFSQKIANVDLFDHHVVLLLHDTYFAYHIKLAWHCNAHPYQNQLNISSPSIKQTRSR